MNDFAVADGSRLLAGWQEGPSLAAHRARYGELPTLDTADLVALTEAQSLAGRGGAGFPFARKLRAVAAGRRPVVVVNWAEGEPASYKDRALAVGRPHLVLDGATLVAAALGAREVHLVLPHESTARRAVARVLAERPARPTWTVHEAQDRFVAGQSAAVLELMAGRTNLPVTTWQPASTAGHRGRATLISNAETYAQLAAAALPRSAELPVTTLLTFNGETAPVVREVVVGTPWSQLLPARPTPVLVGGYHGQWVGSAGLGMLRVDHQVMAAAGVPLGAGVVLEPGPGECPVTATARITAYLAAQSAGRCGPCVNGLPALARSVAELAAGGDTAAEARRLLDLVTGRGACAHPDGTARLVASLLDTQAAEVAAHVAGGCSARARAEAARW